MPRCRVLDRGRRTAFQVDLIGPRGAMRRGGSRIVCGGGEDVPPPSYGPHPATERGHVEAVHLVDELTPVVATLFKHAETSLLPVWPGPLPPLPASLWPDPHDIDGFFTIAADVGTLLYVNLLRVRDLEYDIPAAPDEGAQCTCGFVADGVLLHLSFASKAIHIEAEVVDHVALLDLDNEDRRIEQYARQVFDHEAFHDHGGAGRDDRCAEVVRKAFPDLDDATVRRVVGRGQRLDRIEAKPAREAAIAQEAHQRHADGETKVVIATSMAITTNVLGRIMQQNPPKSSGR